MGRLRSSYGYFAARAASLAVVACALFAFSAWAADVNEADEAVAAQIAEAQRASGRGPFALDGVFQGSAQGYGGLVTMRVTIEEGYIDSVEIVDASQEDEAWLNMCLDIPAKIEAAQSSAVDTVSGATFTSAAMINATTEALSQSVAGDA